MRLLEEESGWRLGEEWQQWMLLHRTLLPLSLLMFSFYYLSFCHGRFVFRFHLSSHDEAEVISMYGRVIY